MSASETPSLYSDDQQEYNSSSTGESGDRKKENGTDLGSTTKAKHSHSHSHSHCSRESFSSLSQAARARRSGTRRTVDLATVEGQLESNPNMSLENARLRAKREYNRKNAARARARNKEMVQDLQAKVAYLTKHTVELERENELLSAQVQVLFAQQKKNPAQSPMQQAPVNPALSTVASQPSSDLERLLSLLQQGQRATQPEPPRQAQPAPAVSQGVSENQLASIMTQLVMGNFSPSMLLQQQEQQPTAAELIDVLGQLLRKSPANSQSSVAENTVTTSGSPTRSESNNATSSVPTRQETLFSILAHHQQPERTNGSVPSTIQTGQSEEDIQHRLQSLNGLRSMNGQSDASSNTSNSLPSSFSSLQAVLTQAQLSQIQQSLDSRSMQQRHMQNQSPPRRYDGQ